MKNEFRMFMGFFAEALKTFPKNPAAILFGSILTGSSAEFLSSLLETGAPLERYRTIVTDFLWSNQLFLLAIPLVLAIATFAKGGLIISLSEKRPTATGTSKKSFGLLPKSYLLEVLYLLSAFLLLAVLLFPAMLTRETQSLGLNLAFLGLMIFLPIAIVLTFVEAYAFFHIMLSGTSVRSSIELGYTLFMRRAATSIMFGTVSVLVVIAASVVIGVLLGVVNAFAHDSLGRTTIMITILFMAQSFLNTVQKKAWLSFFRFIATEKDKDMPATSQEKESMIQREMPEVGLSDANG